MVKSVSNGPALSVGKFILDEKTGRTKMSMEVLGEDIMEYVDKIIEHKEKIKLTPKKDEIELNKKMQKNLLELQGKVEKVYHSLDGLRNYTGAIGDVDNVFQAKSIALTTNSSTTQAKSLVSMGTSRKATCGSFTLQVTQLASADVLTSTNPITAPNRESDLGIGGSITLGTGAKNRTNQTIAITTGMSLQQMIEAINLQSSQSGVVAEAILIGPAQSPPESFSYQFKLKALDTGFPISYSFSNDTGLQSALALPVTPTPQSNLQATVLLDGQAFSRSSNTISDLIPGVTMDLLGASVGTNIYGNITDDPTKVATDIQKFIDVYNDVIDQIEQESLWDNEKGKPHEDAVLYGKSILMNLKMKLDMTLASGAQGSQNKVINSLDSMGIVLDKRSKRLEIKDINVFAKALDENLSEMKAFFGDTNSSASWQFQIWNNPKQLTGVLAPVNGVPQTVTVSYTNTGGIYTANFSVGGGQNPPTFSAVVPVNSPNLINGAPDSVFDGLNMTYNGPPLADGQTATTTFTMSKGIATNLHHALQYEFLSGASNTSGIAMGNKAAFALMQVELEEGEKELKKKVTEVEEGIQKEKEALSRGFDRVYAATIKYDNVMSLLKDFKSALKG